MLSFVNCLFVCQIVNKFASCLIAYLSDCLYFFFLLCFSYSLLWTPCSCCFFTLFCSFFTTSTHKIGYLFKEYHFLCQHIETQIWRSDGGEPKKNLKNAQGEGVKQFTKKTAIFVGKLI